MRPNKPVKCWIKKPAKKQRRHVAVPSISIPLLSIILGVLYYRRYHNLVPLMCYIIQACNNTPGSMEYYTYLVMKKATRITWFTSLQTGAAMLYPSKLSQLLHNCMSMFQHNNERFQYLVNINAQYINSWQYILYIKSHNILTFQNVFASI